MAALSEFELIERFFRRTAANVRVGIGDDAAIVAVSPGCELAVSVDMLVSGRHFFADADPESLGHKTLAVNLSDMAAIGATPRWALLAGALPEVDTAWLAAFARGLFALADAHGVELIGGDTTRGPLTLSVTILGEVPNGTGVVAQRCEAGRFDLGVRSARRRSLGPGACTGPRCVAPRGVRDVRTCAAAPYAARRLGRSVARSGDRGDRYFRRPDRRSRPCPPGIGCRCARSILRRFPAARR